ncbi:MAG: tetraacyldisaccharide 4'-kinase, partial [Mariprofundus sp.]
MSRLHERMEDIWWSPCRPPLLLRCIEPIYRAISSVHLKRRAACKITLPLPLISVGNITAGGSGKTPFVLWLADGLKQLGFSPVILCRGDGGKTSSPVVVSPHSDIRLVGDEAKMLAQMSGCPVVAAADRTAVSDLVSGLGNILILD